MKTQIQISLEIGLTQQAVSSYLTGKARPKWKTIKRLIKILPGTTPELWLEGTPEQIRAAIKNAGQMEQTEHQNEVAA